MASRAVSFIVGKSHRAGSLRLQLHVKPGASKTRQGILSVTDEHIQLCVSAQPRDGQANKAVVELLSDVMWLPKSRFSLIQGVKSRDKTVVVQDVANDQGPAFAQQVIDLLCKASQA